jgi:tetratricopeptide (TPR) repeat protein
MIYRALILLSLLTLIIYPSKAQIQLVDKVYEFLENKDLDKAMTAIDLAKDHATTKNDQRTWYLRGYIYKELFKANTEKSSYRDVAYESLKKSISIDPNGRYVKDCEAVIEYLNYTYYDEAIVNFNDQKHEAALKAFEKFFTVKVKPELQEYVNSAYYYAGISALILDKSKDGKKYLEEALRLGFRNSSLYTELILIYQKEGEKEKAKNLINLGSKEFPEDMSLKITEINYFLEVQNYPEAEKSVELYLQSDPNNIDVLLVAGTVYGRLMVMEGVDKEKYFQKRLNAYKSILKFDRENFMANYNIGITFYNRAVDIIGEQTKTYEVDIFEFSELLNKVTDLFKESLPYIEKAEKLAPKNKNALLALEGIYYNLNDKNKLQEVRAKLAKINN